MTAEYHGLDFLVLRSYRLPNAFLVSHSATQMGLRGEPKFKKGEYESLDRKGIQIRSKIKLA